jgi:hypothetical protein
MTNDIEIRHFFDCSPHTVNDQLIWYLPDACFAVAISPGSQGSRADLRDWAGVGTIMKNAVMYESVDMALAFGGANC